MVRKCRVCGCTEDNACEGGCSWVEDDLCSACADKDIEDDDLEDEDDLEEEVEEVSKSEIKDTPTAEDTTSWNSGEERIKSELAKYKGGGKEKMVAEPVAKALIDFCKNERFSEAVMASNGSFEFCIKKIMNGVGNAISDLEVYQRAAAYYFPNAKISFSMNIDVDGLEMPVQSKEVVATMPAENTKAEVVKPAGFNPFKQETKRITVDLSEFF